MKELITIQSKLKAPKGQYNSFGKYKYRSCEDILEAVKPLCAELNCALTLSDNMCMIGGRFYVQATVTLRNEQGQEVVTTASAREEETKKGMDGSQITGAASSYARKYALNGMFCIDDTKDSDSTNVANITTPKSAPQPNKALVDAAREIAAAQTEAELNAIYYKYSTLQKDKTFISALSTKKKEVQNAA